MKRSCLLVLLLCVITPLIAQTELTDEQMNFILKADTVYPNSGFHKIIVLDQRRDSSQVGVVKTGYLNKKTTLVFRPSLEDQLNQLLQNATISTNSKANRTLLLVIQKLSLSERINEVEESGSFDFCADVYEKKQDSCYHLATLLADYKNSMLDVTTDLLSKSGAILLDKILSTLVIPESNQYATSFLELEYQDSLEKSKMPIYNTFTFNNGIYLTWDSFASQKPDFTGKISCYRNSIKKVLVRNKQNHFKLVSAAKVYAVVADGKPFISYNSRYCPCYFVNDEYQFVGLQKKKGGFASILTGMIFFGIQGAVAGAFIDEYSSYLITINHKDGSFNVLRKLSSQEEANRFDMQE